MPLPAPIFDDEWTGERWIYGMVNRPPGLGCCPDGRIVGADKPNNRPDERCRHGTIEYARPLTEHEIASYELWPIDGPDILMVTFAIQSAYKAGCEHSRADLKALIASSPIAWRDTLEDHFNVGWTERP